jgi:putative transport protein
VLLLVAIGISITLIPMTIAGLIGHYLFRMNFLTLLGVIAGSMTSTPGLAAVDNKTECEAPSVGYATVYPLLLC